jgi:hypothetical protein
MLQGSCGRVGQPDFDSGIRTKWRVEVPSEPPDRWVELHHQLDYPAGKVGRKPHPSEDGEALLKRRIDRCDALHASACISRWSDRPHSEIQSR